VKELLEPAQAKSNLELRISEVSLAEVLNGAMALTIGASGVKNSDIRSGFFRHFSPYREGSC